MKRHFAITIIFLFLCILAVPLTFSSCSYRGYRGDHADLYTVAVNNVFGISGHTGNGEISYDPAIDILETDDYGRTLFFYNESYDTGTDYSMAFVIMQKSEDGYVYYYQDDCYIPFFDDSDHFYHGNQGSEDYLRAQELATEEVAALKERNDWNKPFDAGKCTKTKIDTDKPEGKINVKTWTFDDEIYAYAKQHGYEGTDDNACRWFEYCNADAEGKELYYVYCHRADDDGSGGTTYSYADYAVIVHTDDSIFKNIEIGEHAIVEITNPADAYELIQQLKQQNDWK